MDKVGEAELLAAGRAGRVLDCADGDRCRPVDAALLRRLCHELKGQIDPRGIRLHNAAIAGCLDIAGLHVPFPLRFDRCEFAAPLIMDGAKLHELALTGCVRLPGLLANGLRVRRDFDLSGSHVTGAHRTSASRSKQSAIWLCESHIGGRLLCVDTTIHADGERSIQADRMHVGGTIRLLNHFTAVGEIRLLGVRIDGALDLTGARVDSETGLALDLAEAVIGGSMFLMEDPTGRRPVIHGRLDMGSAQIAGQFLIRNATLAEPAAAPAGGRYSRPWARGSALSASRLSVGAEITLEGASEVTGGVDLSMSDISGLSVGGKCSLRAPGRTAVDLTNAEIRSSLTLRSDVTVAGTLRLTGASIHGNLSLRGATLTEPERSSLVAATGLCVDGSVELQNLRATGGRLRFGSATLGAVTAVGARLVNPGGYTLSLHHTTVRGSVILVGGFQSEGLVMLSRAAIEGRLECGGGSFTCRAPFPRNEDGNAIEAISATIRAGMFLDWNTVSPSVDFTNATTTFLADDPQNWPARFVITGFTYDRFEQSQSSGPGWDQAARCAWLSHQAVYDSGPYEQAARVFRQHGYPREAESILIAQRRQARQAIGGRGARLRRVLDEAFAVSVGYGYRPERVLWLLAALLILVTVSLEIPVAQATMRATTPTGTVYTTRGPEPASGAVSGTGSGTGSGTAGVPGGAPVPGTRTDICGNGEVRCFSPVLYAIDTVVPLVSLGERSTWYPDPHARDGSFMEWWLNAAVLLGWLLSSVFVLSLARLARAG